MKYFILLIALSSSLYAQESDRVSSTPGEDCRLNFRYQFFTPNYGRPKESLNPHHYQEFSLIKSEKTGTFIYYRQASGEKAPFLQKIPFYNSLQNVEGNEKIHKLLKTLAGKVELPFLLPEEVAILDLPHREGTGSDIVLKITGISEGATLHSIMIDEKIGHELKEVLRLKYRQNLTEFAKELLTKTEAMDEWTKSKVLSLTPTEANLYADTVADELPMISYVIPIQGKLYPIIIKSDNILVNPSTLKMTLIDFE